MMPSCDQTGVPGLFGFTHFHSSTTSGSASLMSLRILPRVSPRQSPSSAILFEMSSAADWPWLAPDFFMFSSSLVVLVVTAPPDTRLVAPLGCAVEPLVHAPEAVQSARIGGIGVVDDAVVERERAHARPLARVRSPVGCRARGYLGPLATA